MMCQSVGGLKDTSRIDQRPRRGKTTVDLTGGAGSAHSWMTLPMRPASSDSSECIGQEMHLATLHRCKSVPVSILGVGIRHGGAPANVDPGLGLQAVHTDRDYGASWEAPKQHRRGLRWVLGGDPNCE
jgi:hypothetical protein